VWGIVVSGVLAAACYSYVLQIPFFADDLPIMTWLSHHGWRDVWLSQEKGYYRPLAFAIYKLGLLFPHGLRQGVLHAVPLCLHWASSVLVMQIVRLCHYSFKRALLASVLFAVFPFMSEAIPWVTALSHPLVIALTLLAVYAALKAERSGQIKYWGLSLLATAIAPLAHECGAVCGAIVGGVVLIQNETNVDKKWSIGAVVLGCTLNVGAIVLRELIPGVHSVGQINRSFDPFSNFMFFLHGLLYPIAPIIGWLVQHWGWHDFTLLGVAGGLFALLLAWVVYRSHNWRWAALNLWWWALGALPAAVSLSYGELCVSARQYTLASAGIVVLWVHLIAELSKLARRSWGKHLVCWVLAGTIFAQNVAYIAHERILYTSLSHLYQRVLSVAAVEEYSPRGFVNLHAGLTWKERTYALVTNNLVFVPIGYSNIEEFIEVNQGQPAASVVKFAPIPQCGDDFVCLSPDQVLDWAQLYQLAIVQRTIWLTRYDAESTRFLLDHVGSITQDGEKALSEPLVRYENGPMITSASVQEVGRRRWAIVLNWQALGSVDGEIFVHVRDKDNNVVTQADGPALGGIAPVWMWQAGDQIQDVRYVTIPKQAPGPYTVQVGLYNEQGRFPAFVGDARHPDDAAPIVMINP